MAREKKPKIQEKDLQGLKYFKRIVPLLEGLQLVGTERDQAGNRKLYYDQYVGLLLLYFYNPTVTSLRGIQRASELEKVQKLFGCSRVSLGSLSEAAHVFDPKVLKGIIGELTLEAQPLGRAEDLKALEGLTAVDGTLLPQPCPRWFGLSGSMSRTGQSKRMWPSRFSRASPSMSQ